MRLTHPFVWLCLICAALAQAALVHAQGFRDYAETRPALVKEVASNEEILGSLRGNDEYEREVYQAAAFEVLVETTNEMKWPRMHRHEMTDAEKALNDRLRAGLDAVSIERGAQWTDKQAAKRNYK